MEIQDAVKILAEFKEAKATWGTPLVPAEIREAIETICAKLWEYTGYDYQEPNIQKGYLYVGDWRVEIGKLAETIPDKSNPL